MAKTTLKAEVTGSIWKILKAPGDTVAAGDEIVLIESMKMEIPVICEVAGRLEAIHVGEGDPIGEGQPVATIAG